MGVRARAWYECPLPSLKAIMAAVVKLECKNAADACFRGYTRRCGEGVDGWLGCGGCMLFWGIFEHPSLC